MVRLIPLRLCVRGGTLIPAEFSELPFTPKRAFWVSGMDEGAPRGNHAHKKCHQLIIAMAGSFRVKAEAEGYYDEFLLNDASGGDPSPAAYVPPLVWITIDQISPGAVLFCLASDEFDRDDYIVDRDEFLKLQHHPV